MPSSTSCEFYQHDVKHNDFICCTLYFMRPTYGMESPIDTAWPQTVWGSMWAWLNGAYSRSPNNCWAIDSSSQPIRTSVHQSNDILRPITAQGYIVQPARLQQEEEGLHPGLEISCSCLLLSTHTLGMVHLNEPAGERLVQTKMTCQHVWHMVYYRLEAA